MKVFRGQAKNLRKNIKQNNLKPLLVVFGVLVMITLTYKASNGVIGVGNTMFKEGNGKGRRRGRRQGFEGYHEPGHGDSGTEAWVLKEVVNIEQVSQKEALALLLRRTNLQVEELEHMKECHHVLRTQHQSKGSEETADKVSEETADKDLEVEEDAVRV